MRVGILTFHRATNFGTALQAVATQKIFERVGADAELIDYRPQYIERTLQKRRLLKAKSLKEVLSICVNSVLYPKMVEKKAENFLSFLNSAKISDEELYSVDDISRFANKYDAVVSGSDQLWNKNITSDDTAYFLPFEHKRKISYASSFGESSLSDERKRQIAPYLTDFDFLSVREKTAKNILDEIRVYSPMLKSACTVLDPTLLITSDEWNNYADAKLSLPKDGFILTYYMIETEKLRRVTERLRQLTGLTVVNLKPSKKQVIAKDGVNLPFAGPSQLLSCFNQASYVVTNSFHGTAFSINYGIPFITCELPESMAGKVNSRLTDVLETFKLSDRWVDNDTDIESLDITAPLNDEYKDILEALRKASFDYISNSLKAE